MHIRKSERRKTSDPPVFPMLDYRHGGRPGKAVFSLGKVCYHVDLFFLKRPEFSMNIRVAFKIDLLVAASYTLLPYINILVNIISFWSGRPVFIAERSLLSRIARWLR